MTLSRISFYFDASRIGNWTWQQFVDGNIGVNGTDGQLLSLVYGLSVSNLYEIYFFTNSLPGECNSVSVLFAEDLSAAITKSKEIENELFIFLNLANEETVRGLKLLQDLKMKSILWDHNGPQIFLDNLIVQNKYISRIVGVSYNHVNIYRHKPYFNRMTYIYNGKDFPVVQRTGVQEKNSIAYIGALTETKGFHWVLDAWPKVKKALPDATLTVYGSIKTHGVQNGTGTLGLCDARFEEKYIYPFLGTTIEEINAKGIHFKGHVSFNELVGKLSRHSLGIVNPNVTGSIETFCLSALDFQAAGVPVIGGNAGGLKETVWHNKTGVLIDNPGKLGKTIIDLCTDFKKRQSLASKNFYKKFSREQANKAWSILINEALLSINSRSVSLNLKYLSVKDVIKEGMRIKNRLIKN